MRRRRIVPLAAAALLSACAQTPAKQSAPDEVAARVAQVVAEAVPPLLREHDIPGVAVAVVAGDAQWCFPFGVASRTTGRAVDARTLFEIGSVSKTLTATLGAYAEARGAWSLADVASKYAPELAGTAFDTIPVLDLATYTAGGLPLQFPGDVEAAAVFDYYRAWRPAHAPGTHRVYSNPSIGLFGHLAARSLAQPFGELLERTLLPGLGLHDTFVQVPAARTVDYADGHAHDGRVVRVAPGPFAAEAYGIRTTAADLARLVAANLDAAHLAPDQQHALAATHVGRYRVGPMTQCLGWESFADVGDLEALLAATAPAGTAAPHRVQACDATAAAPRALFHKTGATNGFSAYVVFAPQLRAGVVLLANRNVPAAARIRVAHRLLLAAAAIAVR